jgi:hypothetical protein
MSGVLPNCGLQARDNLVVLFEETANTVPTASVRKVALVVLHEHPPLNT